MALKDEILKNNTVTVLVGLLGLLFNCSPHNFDELAQSMKQDADLYAKLAGLEATHGKWLKEHQNVVFLKSV
jgi:hypothetical protein